MNIKQIVNSLNIREDWKLNYKELIPKFIDSVKKFDKWEDWEANVFDEFFNNTRTHCVSSLPQGYYTLAEREVIKQNWSGLNPLLRKLASSHKTPNFELYWEISNYLDQFVKGNKPAAANRMIASLQPKFLCTIVTSNNLKVLFKKLEQNLTDITDLPKYTGDWFKDSNAILNFLMVELNAKSSFDIITFPWQIKDEWFPEQDQNNNKLSMNKSYLSLLENKKQIILQGPPGTGKTRLAKEIAKELNKTYWNRERIKSSLTIGQYIPKASGTLNYYTITNITANYFELESDRTSKLWKATFNGVLLKLDEIDKGVESKSKGGNDPYELAVAKYLYFHLNDSNITINKGNTSFANNNLTEFNNFIEGYKKYLKLKGKNLAEKTIVGYVETAREEITFRWQDYYKEDSTNFKNDSNSYKKILNIISINYEGERNFSGITRFTAYLNFIIQNNNSNSVITPSLKSTEALPDYNLIQFHPSYTYEDFVRGITVKNNESGQIEYKTENKVLAEMAKKAKENWDNHHFGSLNRTKDEQLDEWFADFVDTIQLKLEETDEMLMLTENFGISSIDETAFRYKSVNLNRSPNGLRMYFKDIKTAFLDGNKERQDIKKNKSLSGLAIQHASYYIKVLNMFQEYVKNNDLEFDNKGEKEPLKNYVLIIDEINRANLSSVLGELIYALEYRGEPVESMYELDGSREIVLPPNLYIIGTMNTADRSVGQIDYAIRRRFAYVDVLPKVIEDSELVEEKTFATHCFKNVASLFVKDNTANRLEASEHLSEEFKPEDVWLGHSYFIYDRKSDFNINLEYEIKPILKEYVTDGILKESALDVIHNLSGSDD